MKTDNLCRRFGSAQEGAVITEYGLIVFLVAVALIVVIKVLTDGIIPLFIAP